MVSQPECIQIGAKKIRMLPPVVNVLDTEQEDDEEEDSADYNDWRTNNTFQEGRNSWILVVTTNLVLATW